jgi:hypothetical protein
MRRKQSEYEGSRERAEKDVPPRQVSGEGSSDEGTEYSSEAVSEVHEPANGSFGQSADLLKRGGGDERCHYSLHTNGERVGTDGEDTDELAGLRFRLKLAISFLSAQKNQENEGRNREKTNISGTL